MKVVIIEDEPRTAKELCRILENLDNSITVVKILGSVAGAIEWFKEQPSPDLIFSDIQLGDGLSFEIFKEVKLNIPIVFCTAFDEYALHAFESNSIDYILKPLEEEMVERSILKYNRVKEHYQSDTYSADLNRVLVQMDGTYKQSMLLHYREKIIPVKVGDICYAYANAGVTTLHALPSQDYTVSYTIDQLETMLNPQLFFRANRQFIINRNAILDLEHYFNRRMLLKLQCATPVNVIVSRLKVQDFMLWLES